MACDLIKKVSNFKLFFSGNDDNMGTNANLFMEVCGNNGSTEKLPLEPDKDDKKKDDTVEKTKEKEEPKEKKDKGKEIKNIRPVKNRAGTVKQEEKKEKGEGKKEDMKFPPGSVQQVDVSIFFSF